MINEPDVALTDFAIAIESGLFAYSLWQGRGRTERLARWFAFFFMATAVGALAGGAVHGFFPGERWSAERVLWPASLIALGAGAMAAWAIGAIIGFGERMSRVIIRIAQLEWLFYTGAIVSGWGTFERVILNYLPAAVFLMVMFTIRWRATRDRSFILGICAMVLTFVAAGVQESRFDLGLKILSYNALYHLIQGMALLLLFLGARRITEFGKS